MASRITAGLIIANIVYPCDIFGKKTEHIIGSKVYSVTFAILESNLLVTIIINQDMATLMEIEKKKQKDMQLQLDKICEEIIQFEQDIISDAIFEKAIEDNGASMITLVHNRERLKLKINEMKRPITYDQQVYSSVIAVGSCHMIADVIVYSHFDEPTVIWEHKIKTITQSGIQPGQKVLARWHGSDGFWKAVVKSTNKNGTCLLRYDDEEDLTYNVPLSNIIVETKADSLQPGQHVMALFTKAFFEAIVIAIDTGGTYDIQYIANGGTVTRTLDKIRLI